MKDETDRGSALHRIEDARASESRALSLSDEDIAEIPRGIRSLAGHLEELNLSWCMGIRNVDGLHELSTPRSAKLKTESWERCWPATLRNRTHQHPRNLP
jgi:hypothetical protein